MSRLIADDGLPASHDQPTGTIVVHHVEPTRLQVGASACAPACLPQQGLQAVLERVGSVLVRHAPHFRLQTLAGTFSDKASLLVDLNERALAMRTGAPGIGRTCFHFKSQEAR